MKLPRPERPAAGPVVLACALWSLALSGSASALGPQTAAAEPPARSGGDSALSLRDGGHLRALYFDLLGRPPTTDEAELAAGGRAELLVRLLAGSREFWEAWYEDELLHFLLLDAARPEDPPAAESLPARLADGRQHLPGAVRELVLGQAFHRANPGNDTFVSVVLEQLLGVVVQRSTALLEAGKKMYDGRSASLFGEQGRSQADVVSIVTRQPEFVRRLVERQYLRVTGLVPTRAQTATWAAQLQEHPESFPELVVQWLLAPEYAARLAQPRLKSDLQFLRGLWVDLLGVPPPPAELARLRSALGVLSDAGPLRSVIARVLIERHAARFPRRQELDPAGPAAEVWIDSMFRRFLGRGASPDELAAFSLVYRQEPDCRPGTLVIALVTHEEYRYY